PAAGRRLGPQPQPHSPVSHGQAGGVARGRPDAHAQPAAAGEGGPGGLAADGGRVRVEAATGAERAAGAWREPVGARGPRGAGAGAVGEPYGGRAMNLSGDEMLRRLGAGESIASVCGAAGIAREAFDSWWRAEAAARVPAAAGTRRAGVSHPVRI